MTIEAGTIQKLRQRIDQANQRRVAAETRAQSAREEVERLLAQAKSEYNVASLAELEALIATESEQLEQRVTGLSEALDLAEAAAQALPA